LREFNINALEGKLINNGIRWHGHVLETMMREPHRRLST
jgi:hypothetical protein